MNGVSLFCSDIVGTLSWKAAIIAATDMRRHGVHGVDSHAEPSEDITGHSVDP